MMYQKKLLYQTSVWENFVPRLRLFPPDAAREQLYTCVFVWFIWSERGNDNAKSLPYQCKQLD